MADAASGAADADGTVPFYDLSEAERASLTLNAMRDRRSLHRRWRALTSDEAAGWRDRAALAAAALGEVRSVLDLGCGTMALRELLPADVLYIPSDIVSRGPGTIVCDYNVQGVPQVDTEAVACLGLLEYLYDPATLLGALRQPRAVVSYCARDVPEPFANRRSHAWVNDYATDEVEALFAASGWTVVSRQLEAGRQWVWLLRRTA